MIIWEKTIKVGVIGIVEKKKKPHGYKVQAQYNKLLDQFLQEMTIVPFKFRFNIIFHVTSYTIKERKE